MPKPTQAQQAWNRYMNATVFGEVEQARAQHQRSASWWIGLSREQFTKQVQHEQPRMATSKIGHSLGRGYAMSEESEWRG